MSEAIEVVTDNKSTKKLAVDDINLTATVINRYVVTSYLPVLTQEEIANSIEIHDKVNELFRELLTNNDRQLLCNIIDSSGKVILTQDQLKELLVVVLSLTGETITTDDIRIKYSEDIISTCLKTSVSPFKSIISIKVFEQDLAQTQPYIYSVIAGSMKISLDTFYSPVFKT